MSNIKKQTFVVTNKSQIFLYTPFGPTSGGMIPCFPLPHSTYPLDKRFGRLVLDVFLSRGEKQTHGTKVQAHVHEVDTGPPQLV